MVDYIIEEYDDHRNDENRSFGDEESLKAYLSKDQYLCKKSVKDKAGNMTYAASRCGIAN